MNRHDQTVGTLEDLIADASARASRPRLVPREVLAQALQNLLAGVGAGSATWAVMAYTAAPWSIETGLVVAISVAGGLMVWRGMADEIYDMRKLNTIKRTAERLATDATQRANVAEKRLEAALDALDDLERAMLQTQRDLDAERILRAQLQERVASMPRRTNYTTARAEPEPQDARDAREILRRWYQGGDYMSRPKAIEVGWTQQRHTAAQRLLRDAQILLVNEKQARIVPATLDDATKLLSDHLIRIKAQAEPLETDSED